MKPFDGEAFGLELTQVVKDYLAREVREMNRRMDAIEAEHAAYKGAYDAGCSYQKGATVTFEGRRWKAAQAAAVGDVPGEDLDTWRVA
ncbi:hypothetical protein [Aurantimonas sp. 22II-16-19i]|uniref:hypothetical protein n=1 Tax=Aurantimonas sp. 22II-16-19i TaxID=1317114 RepID=UPI00111C710D|nr:hypothetical protein [Aurantimonas sp. 22II-16-19i]